ncbi:hypothetical protein [Microbacterium aquilitoris]|uniref:hypothetical protein n=1 Tax=Microbacterium aquilitoris TaxID=3067307 RepID=UPI00289188CF|nr:hypothetical protein [Microbacterium sp. KSW2-22]MDT3344473.1 hypothetical protein [Microbacterium sp. KSW2-22]
MTASLAKGIEMVVEVLMLDKIVLAGLAVLAGGGLAKGIKSIRETQRRRATAPVFDDGLTESDFRASVDQAVRKTPRVVEASVAGLVVAITVRSSSGLTKWSAEIDLNDYGHLTGRYWIRSENSQSPIPQHFAHELTAEVERRRNPRIADPTVTGV